MKPQQTDSSQSSEGTQSAYTSSAAPSLSLPKGGGAIRGIGEKFAANPVTGTGSMTVPIATSPGRNGFGPQLSLSYDSGAGNGPFGFGWSLSLPAITRKTDKGLPKYIDETESDVFILSGAEDLVPVFRQDPTGTWVRSHPGYQLSPDGAWVRDSDGNLVVHEHEQDGYRIRRYRPRIEGLFARIERWTRHDGEVHWRSISKDNILTIYGKNQAQIADPDDPHHVFSWLICESRDDKGNAIVYEYKAEDGEGLDLTSAHESNRGLGDDKRRSVNRYLKRAKYGNRIALLDPEGRRPTELTQAQIDAAGWMFEVVFDYDEGHVFNVTTGVEGRQAVEAAVAPQQAWTPRQDPFSTYRPGFEVRTARLCRRVLMFHHFREELSTPDYLVRATELSYAESPLASFLLSVSHSGFRRLDDGSYLKRSLPPVEFEYSKAPTPEELSQLPIQQVDAESLDNLPVGLDNESYQWIDLHGEGVPGILTEQAAAWFYKRNLSPLSSPDGHPPQISAHFAPTELVAHQPNLSLADGRAQFIDLAGDGQLDLAVLDGPTPGLYEHDEAEGWESFKPLLLRLNRSMRDPNLRLVDLNGDGHVDILITEDDALIWHSSLAENGFDSAWRVPQAIDEELGPRLVFANGEQSIYLADFSGDGLTDIARIRNGEVCYWPNLGYGRFGAKVSMDNAPWFDGPEQFDQRRIRLADIDGSGTTDIIYLRHDGVCLYFNQCGNSWSRAQLLPAFAPIDNTASVVPVDLLGNGTACLVWSSPLPNGGRPQMWYVNLMGGQKPHLLVQTRNNLGAETNVTYAASTKYYLQDKRDGKPWITRLPFPVHVVERVETRDHVSRNRFVTRYTYHHGYFDGEEREFRGFAMVEQQDTEQYAALTADGSLPSAANLDAASHVPPVLTKTWFHTGIYSGRSSISDFFAGTRDSADRGEYYREPAWLEDDEAAKQRLLPDTIMPDGLSADEEREACRALKGMMLRQEIYALDGIGKDEDYPYGHPYTVVEQNFTVTPLQLRERNRHAAFFTHPREAVTYHYERNPDDPRVQHALTLDVDAFGNVLKSLAVGYGRRHSPLPEQSDRERQTKTLITYTENRVTNGIDNIALYPDDYRTPLPAETRTYEITGFQLGAGALRFSFAEWAGNDFQQLTSLATIAYEEDAADQQRRRLIEQVRTLYRRDDLTALLGGGELEPRALPGEGYKLAFTPGLLAQVYQRNGHPLLSAPESVLGGQGADAGGYVDLDGNGCWWIPSGRSFFSVEPGHTAAQELAEASAHFFLPRRYRNPFGYDTTVAYDGPANPALPRYDLLVAETRDAVGNVTTAFTADDDNVVALRIDYRVLLPYWITDPNGNRARVIYDVLGLVCGTAIMGKPRPADLEGDSLDGFVADLQQSDVAGFYSADDPHVPAGGLLQGATTRIIYDLDCFQRTHQAHPDDPTQWQPVFAATLARETHLHDAGGDKPKVQISFSYSDGFGREIQKKVQAEPGPIVKNGPKVNPRWVGSGWAVFNNKGKPVRQFEPYFSQLAPRGHQFEFGLQVGVSPILFYDPAERVVATLHPHHLYEKVLFDPWEQTTWDANDTVDLLPDTDEDVKHFFVDSGGNARLPDTDYRPTWYDLRTNANYAAEFEALYPSAITRSNEASAAAKAKIHAGTPATVYLDTLGRPFLTIALNRFEREGAIFGEELASRVELDIEGNQRQVRDADTQGGDNLGRIVMRYDYDMLGNRIHQTSMEAGERWVLNDIAGKPIRNWDSLGRTGRTEYDMLRRPLRIYVTGADPMTPTKELLTERLVYGEKHPEAKTRNLQGVLHLHLDQAGASSSEFHDFKGNLQVAARRLAVIYNAVLDWSAGDQALPQDTIASELLVSSPFFAQALEKEAYVSSTVFDALNRPLEVTTPHTPAMAPCKVRHAYNDAGLLETVDAQLPRKIDDVDPSSWTPFVTGMEYDAKGQRLQVDYGNQVNTRYEYDPFTFRLMRLGTNRDAGKFPDDCPTMPASPPPLPADEWPGCQVQNLFYTYDPVGNITHIRDDAQQKIFFKNQRVDPSAEYTYDAIYRLIEATGREHLGQAGGAPIPHSYNDARRIGIFAPGAGTKFHPNDGNAMGRYCETYKYDLAGNLTEMKHSRTCADLPSWGRVFSYEETSLLENGSGSVPLKRNNRLTSSTVAAITEVFSASGDGYDAHGNMLKMPHLPVMQWDYRDQLQMSRRQAIRGGIDPDDKEGSQRDGERTYYVYDSAGQRVRKVTVLATGQVKDERVYLAGFELYRQVTPNLLVLGTLQIVDDKQCIALVEMEMEGTAIHVSSDLVRFQYGNHLGSAVLELDTLGAVITYEEYTPYGSTSYQAVQSQTQSVKRYRYSGKERDAESGLVYYGARYYVAWLGRWANCDPIGITDCVQLYCFVRNNPIQLIDPSGASSKVPKAFWSGARDQAIETASSMLQALTLDLATAGAYGRYQTLQGFKKAYDEAGGGVYGVLNAANTLNPMNTVLTQGWLANEEAGQAFFLEKIGDAAGAARHAANSGAAYTNMAVGALQLGATVAGGVNLARKLSVPGTFHGETVPVSATSEASGDTAPSASLRPSATPDSNPGSGFTPPKDLKAAFRRAQVQALKQLDKNDEVRKALLNDKQKLPSGRGNKNGPGYEAGHLDAHLSGKAERLAIQSADLNGLAGRTIESRNSKVDRATGNLLTSTHEALEIRPGVFIEVGTLLQEIRMGRMSLEVLEQAKPSQGWTWSPKKTN